MKSPLDHARARLPLTVTGIEVDDAGIGIVGKNWRYRVNADWRVVSGDEPPRVLASSTDVDVRRSLTTNIVGADVIGLRLRKHGKYVDVTAQLGNGNSIEVESDLPYGEWILSIWDPGDPRQIPVYDLSGPLAPDTR